MVDRILRVIASLQLTVVCLCLAILLVFFGTLAQVNEGLFQAQARWFRSLFIWVGPAGAGWRVPVFPGGYLVGSVLVINLIAAQLTRLELAWRKLGLHLAHGGVILLLLGQLMSDLLMRETHMSFAEGETRNYSTSGTKTELVFSTDLTDTEVEVVAIPLTLLVSQRELRHEKLPFTLRVRRYLINADVRQRAPMMDTNPPPASAGFGASLTLVPLPPVKQTDERNLPAVVFELIGPQGSLGTWLAHLGVQEQEVAVGDQTWRMALRSERHYYPFSVKLLKTTHEVYPGTDIPKNFQSRVHLENSRTGESRDVDIYMNNPLRYEGLTFYQYQMGRDELDRNRGTSVLQVVRNPSWLAPYAGCTLVSVGLLLQFMTHLVAFMRERRTA